MNDQHLRIDGYHAHVYYDTATRPTAQHLATAALDALSVELGGFSDEPVGPHPVGNVQLIFTPAAFASVVPWLMQNRNGLSVLVHPLTDDSVRDHSEQELWLGAQVPLRLHAMKPGYTPDLLPST
jgi:DOPA 4,5-dioxygenase